MLEFVFKKADIQAMIADSQENEDEILVRLKFSPRKDGAFPARIIARCQKAYDSTEALDGREASGCPRPPGCND